MVLWESLQFFVEEATHRQPVDDVEGPPAGGVMGARKGQNLVRQAPCPESLDNLARENWQERRIIARPDQQALEIPADQSVHIGGGTDDCPVTAQVVLSDGFAKALADMTR